MSWRTILISKSSKLDYQMGYLIVRQENIKKIHLSEISLLIVESTAVSITCALMIKLLQEKIKVIFCDEKRNPVAELIQIYGAHDSSFKIKKQIKWKKYTKELVWAEIIKEKLKNQSKLLKICEKRDRSEIIDNYIREVKPGDVSNREAHGAKVYFNGLFGNDFSRSKSDSFNACLNYGYSILLSIINREIVSAGYLTQIGIFHENMFNFFNLSSDLIEPFRTIVDKKVYDLQPQKLEMEEKIEMLKILNEKVVVSGQNQYLPKGIKIYTNSIMEALNDDNIDRIKFCTWE